MFSYALQTRNFSESSPTNPILQDVSRSVSRMHNGSLLFFFCFFSRPCLAMRTAKIFPFFVFLSPFPIDQYLLLSLINAKPVAQIRSLPSQLTPPVKSLQPQALPSFPDDLSLSLAPPWCTLLICSRNRLARTLPSCTPSWSKELIFQINPCKTIFASYKASNPPIVYGFSLSASSIELGLFPAKKRFGFTCCRPVASARACASRLATSFCCDVVPLISRSASCWLCLKPMNSAGTMVVPWCSSW